MSRMTNEDPEGVDTPIGQPVVAITGAGGYLGSVLVAAFGSAGYTVHRLLRSPGSGGGDHHFDLNSVASCDALDGVDLLVHCAYDMALTSRAAIWQTNVFGTVALFDLALSLGVRRTIALSSMSAYPGTRQLYGRAKLAVEAAALDRGLCVSAPRPGLWSRRGRNGRDAAPVGHPSRASRLRPAGTANSLSPSRILRPLWSHWPGQSECLPSRWASPIPSRSCSRSY